MSAHFDHLVSFVNHHLTANLTAHNFKKRDE